MKNLVSQFTFFVQHRSGRRNLKILLGLLGSFIAFVAVFTALFHFFMALEGRSYSLLTGVYWTLTVMSTLGFGDITFHSVLGRIFIIEGSAILVAGADYDVNIAANAGALATVPVLKAQTATTVGVATLLAVDTASTGIATTKILGA